jgi:two-component system response regulator HydG
MCDLLVSELRSRGFETRAHTSPQQAVRALGDEDIDVVITDLRMQGMTGVELCQRVVSSRPDVPVILMTAHGDKQAVVAALRVRAFDFIEKPLDMNELAAVLERALSCREGTAQRIDHEAADRTGVADPLPGSGILGASPPMRALFGLIERLASVDATVLVRGESGTGKELVARAIHDGSKRHASPFVALNCAAIPPMLLEAELFGHVKGAFTDARTAREGLFERARGGTLFLDEIGDLDLSLQPKLLRALQERAIRPLGAEREIEVDVRVITATNVDLADAVLKREFRADLFYRLNVVEVVVPPLRERGDDVLHLAEHFLRQYARAMARDVVGLTNGCAAKLGAYSWPGNVRELANVLERAVALAPYSLLDVADLPQQVRDPGSVGALTHADGGLASLAEVERQHIRRVLEATHGNKSRAAVILGVDRRTLYRKEETEKRQAMGETTPAAPLQERSEESAVRTVPGHLQSSAARDKREPCRGTTGTGKRRG